jgi:hypothetical protein
MEMRDAFSAIGAVIDDQAETRIVQAFLFGHGLRDKDEMAEKRFIFGLGGRHARDFPFGNNQNMNRGLGLNIVERHAAVVFKNDPGGNFAGDDFREDGAHDGREFFGQD